METDLFDLCIDPNGKLHWFPVPVTVDHPTSGPAPRNLPQVELAVSILMLVEAGEKSEFTEQVANFANDYLRRLQTG
jgi:hypothetical protein